MLTNLKYLPNLISITRALTTPVLGWLAYHELTSSFAWLLLAAYLSDIADGWLARKFDWVSRTDAVLDSSADILLTLVMLFAIWQLHRYVYLDHGTILLGFIVTWSCVHCAAIYRYQKLASFHTLLTKIAIIFFAVFVLALFFLQFIVWLWYLAGVLGIMAGIENLIMIALLPTWEPNSRAGLITVLNDRRSQI